MEQQSAYLDLTILSASDLKRSWLSGDQTVAVAWVDPSSKKTTGVTSGGGSNAEWDEKLTLPLNNADASSRKQGKWLTIEIRSPGALGNNLLGTVHVPVAELHLDMQKGANSTQTYQIVLPSGKRYGSVTFLGKVVKPGSSTGSSKPLPSAPPASLHAHNTGSQSNALYPPVSHFSIESSNEKPHYSTIDAFYPPQAYASPNCPNTEDTHNMSSPYRVPSHPPQVYPPVNASCPPHYPPACCAPGSSSEAIVSYPPQFSSTPYPPPTSMYQHPTPYPPNFAYPPLTAPHHSQTPYPPPSLYPYPTHSSPLYPPVYPPPHAPVNCYCPYPAY